MKETITTNALQLTWYLLLPILVIILPQALYVRRTTIRLPEASPVEPPSSYEENDLSLLHLGESTVAGVGVKTLKDGLTASIASALESDAGCKINWKAVGVNGIKMGDLLDHTKEQPTDIANLVIVTMGVNDTTSMTSLRKWESDTTNMIAWLKSYHKAPIVFTELPPIMKFPALPAPLRYLIGLRANLLNRHLKRICHSIEGVYCIGAEPNFDTAYMAEDGYHPSALGYREWAKALSPQLLKIINP